MYAIPPNTKPVTTQCVVAAAQVEHVPLAAVVAVMRTEGGQVGQAHPNPDGSVDYGPMQVNSRWLPRLSHAGIDKKALKNDGCINVLVGAWILRRQMEQTPNQPWTAIGHYHSHTKPLSRRYQRKVMRVMLRVRKIQKVVQAANGH